MKKILLSGSFASGKTELSVILSKLGAGIIDVDCLCEDLFNPEGDEQMFWYSVAGDACYKDDDSLDSNLLLEWILSNPAVFFKVRDYIFPKLTYAVQEEMNSLCAKCTHPYLLLVSPTGPMPYKKWITLFKLEFILIEAPLKLRISRLMQRHNFSEKKARVLAIKGEDWVAKARPHSNRIITNDGSIERLTYQAEQLHLHFLRG